MSYIRPIFQPDRRVRRSTQIQQRLRDHPTAIIQSEEMVDPIITRLNINDRQCAIGCDQVFRVWRTRERIRQSLLFVRQEPIALRLTDTLILTEEWFEINCTPVGLMIHPFVRIDSARAIAHQSKQQNSNLNRSSWMKKDEWEERTQRLWGLSDVNMFNPLESQPLRRKSRTSLVLIFITRWNNVLFLLTLIFIISKYVDAFLIHERCN